MQSYIPKKKQHNSIDMVMPKLSQKVSNILLHVPSGGEYLRALVSLAADHWLT